MLKKYLECGKIVSTHGVRGEVKVLCWCDGPEYLCAFKTVYMNGGAERLAVEGARPHKDMALIKLSGVNGMEEAAKLRGKILYIDRDDDTSGGVFLQDFFGLEVSDADTGESYGKITDVIETGANDVYEITARDGKKRLIPAIPDVVLETDFNAGAMTVRPLPGLFDE